MVQYVGISKSQTMGDFTIVKGYVNIDGVEYTWTATKGDSYQIMMHNFPEYAITAAHEAVFAYLEGDI